MELFPAKFEWNCPKNIYSDDQDFEIVDGLIRGTTEVYFDRAGLGVAIIVICEECIESLRDELNDGHYSGKLEPVVRAILKYAEENPLPGDCQNYCFAVVDG